MRRLVGHSIVPYDTCWVIPSQNVYEAIPYAPILARHLYIAACKQIIDNKTLIDSIQMTKLLLRLLLRCHVLPADNTFGEICLQVIVSKRSQLPGKIL